MKASTRTEGKIDLLVIGGGGREHALSWKLAQSPKAGRVFVAPGNAGTELDPDLTNVPISSDDIEALLTFAKSKGIGLTVVGPEAPLVAGIVDRFREAGLAIFGPSAGAAQLEGSKTFAKDFLSRHAIPTAEYRSFQHPDEALAYVRSRDFPVVIKADGLAAGKGVVIAENQVDAERTILDMLGGGRFGEAGRRVVVERFLEGEEASFMVLAEGTNYAVLASSQDHKRVGEGDTGPNTGGMGAYSPAPVVTPDVQQRVLEQIIEPTLRGMRDEGLTYSGFLYAGLMIDDAGNPFVIEFNCRMGDPETQPILMRLQSDLLQHCLACVEGTLPDEQLSWDDRPALGIVLAAGGYPESYEKGLQISGLDTKTDQDLMVFHAGTNLSGSQVITAGGRVLCVTALGDDLAKAQQKALERAENIVWKDRYYRRDIGYRALKSRTG